MFDNAEKKICRADQHIADLSSEFESFVDSCSYRIVTKAEPQTGALLLRLHFPEPIPELFGLIIGDAIHNLRAALDHLMWELIGIDKGTQDPHLHFPCRNSLQGYEAACKGIQTPRTDTTQFLLGHQVYPSGKAERLYGLHALDITDKHRVITPLVTAGRINKMKAVYANGFEVVMEDCGGEIRPDGYVNLLSAGPDVSIEFDKDTKATPDVFFDKVELFPFKPVIPALMQLSEDVRNMRKAFITFVETRPP